jgi:hypothetical protein
MSAVVAVVDKQCVRLLGGCQVGSDICAKARAIRPNQFMCPAGGIVALAYPLAASLPCLPSLMRARKNTVLVEGHACGFGPLTCFTPFGPTPNPS